jgi:hypothetical protein
MKIVKLAIAILAALWTAGVVFGVIAEMGKHGGTRGIATLAGGVAAAAMMGLITYWLFQWALRKPPSPPTTSP